MSRRVLGRGVEARFGINLRTGEIDWLRNDGDVATVIAAKMGAR